jgi:hypothetical protein
MRGVRTQCFEELFSELLQEIAQAHFRRAPATDEELVALREQCNQLRVLLCPDNAGTRLPEPLQRRLAAELAWIEHSIATLPRR